MDAATEYNSRMKHGTMLVVSYIRDTLRHAAEDERTAEGNFHAIFFWRGGRGLLCGGVPLRMHVCLHASHGFLPIRFGLSSHVFGAGFFSCL